MARIEIGKKGEELAEQYLLSKGHTILELRYKNKLGEIDIISFKQGVLHFVEVKTRSQSIFGSPGESVTKNKLRHIRNVANSYIKGIVNPEVVSGYSIDVIEITINHIREVM